MKLSMLSFLLCCVMLAGSAQSDKYAAVMQKNISALDAAKTPAELQDVAASFERVGDAEKTQTLTYY